MSSSSVGPAGVLMLGVLGLCRMSGGQSADFETLFREGTEAMRQGRLDAAADDFSRCISLSPNFAQSYFNLGLVRLQQARPEDSAALLKKSLELNPKLRGADLFLGIAQYRLDRYEEAVKSLRVAAKSEPSNPEALMWLGIAELAAGDARAAIENLQAASQLNANQVDVLYHLGKAYMQLSKQTYERMYQADPKSWRVHQVLSQSFEQADRLDDAAKECLEAIAIAPGEPGLHQQLGDIYWKQNYLDKAAAQFESELQSNPQNLTAMYKLAVVSIERSKPQAAAELLAEVLRKHPESREAHYQMGRAEAQSGQSEAAIRDFSAAASGSGEVDSEILRQSYYQLSQLYRRAQRPEEARFALNSFLRLKQQADAQQDKKLQDKLKRSTESQPQGTQQ
jgi:tetratricopeptide (TPR) repeat protein